MTFAQYRKRGEAGQAGWSDWNGGADPAAPVASADPGLMGDGGCLFAADTADRPGTMAVAQSMFQNPVCSRHPVIPSLSRDLVSPKSRGRRDTSTRSG
jgi:hypothetical protein